MTTYKIAVSQYTLDRKLQPGDPAWKQFNAGFINYELDPGRIAGAIYEGRAITTQHKNNWRVSENYLCGQHIGLDFDAGDASSSMAFLKKDVIVSKYASFLYSTVSHTDEAPRSRVIFLLDKPIVQPLNYALAASAMLWIFGGADAKCKDPVRFFYGSKGCKFELIGNVLPLEKLKHLIKQYQDTGQREKKRTEFNAPADMQEVKAALDAINPWQIDYDEWVNVLMGIHSQFGSAGLPMAESWGQGKQDEVSRKWKSFDAAGNISGAVTIATVFGIAKRFGWRKNNA